MEALTPVAVESGVAALQPSNTMIQFVGTHAGDDPNPRVGVFQKFSGVAKVNNDEIESIEVEINAGSLETEIDKLTNHLKSPDFLDVALIRLPNSPPQVLRKAKAEITMSLKSDADG